ncbi:tetratricopeptide repeat protein [Striga asiatica]|uniref:Tetratricopeptide repeat protein n=1 Tax=Striga asiatica TaxID=4170 RepID=A0A5A7PHK4_STRAF|nr:tetratricopeptide repeat protein [Striga asiatica]
MASRCRTISRPAMNLLKSAIAKPSSRPVFSVQPARSSPSLLSSCYAHSLSGFSSNGPNNVLQSLKLASLSPFGPSYTCIFRPLPQMGALMSLLPLHTAVSSARLTSCLGPDTNGCRSLSQGMLCSANPGV